MKPIQLLQPPPNAELQIMQLRYTNDPRGALSDEQSEIKSEDLRCARTPLLMHLFGISKVHYSPRYAGIMSLISGK